jgi:hypothetical protein
MANSQPFEWGQSVQVIKEVHRHSENREVTWGTYPWKQEPIYGRIVGVTYKQEGTKHYGSWDDQGHLEVKNTVKLCRVAVSWRKEVLAFAEDLELCPDQEMPFNRSPKWTAKDRADMRSAMEGWPRDEKGHFKPYEPKTKVT